MWAGGFISRYFDGMQQFVGWQFYWCFDVVYPSLVQCDVFMHLLWILSWINCFCFFLSFPSFFIFSDIFVFCSVKTEIVHVPVVYIPSDCLSIVYGDHTRKWHDLFDYYKYELYLRILPRYYCSCKDIICRKCWV